MTPSLHDAPRAVFVAKLDRACRLAASAVLEDFAATVVVGQTVLQPPVSTFLLIRSWLKKKVDREV